MLVTLGEKGEKYTFETLDWSSRAYKFLDDGEQQADCKNKAMWQRLKRRFLEAANNHGFLGVRDWLLDEIYTYKPDMRESGVLYDLFHAIFDAYNADTITQCKEYLLEVKYNSAQREKLGMEPLWSVVAMQAPGDEDAFSMIFQAWLDEPSWQVRNLDCSGHGNKMDQFKDYLGEAAQEVCV